MTVIKLLNTSESLRCIKKEHPARVLSMHQKMSPGERHHAYFRQLYGGPGESDYTSVSVDLSFCGDPPRFVISGTLYTMYHKIGDVRDRIDEFGGIQKKTVTDYIQRLT